MKIALSILVCLMGLQAFAVPAAKRSSSCMPLFAKNDSADKDKKNRNVASAADYLNLVVNELDHEGDPERLRIIGGWLMGTLAVADEAGRERALAKLAELIKDKDVKKAIYSECKKD